MKYLSFPVQTSTLRKEYLDDWPAPEKTMASPTNTELIEAALVDPSNEIPADVTLAFLQESKDRGAIIAILVITSFVMVVVAVRCYARCASARGFGLDDWMAVTALVSGVKDITFKRNADKSCRLRSSHFQYSPSSSSILALVDILLTSNMFWTMQSFVELRFWTSGHTWSTRPVC